MNDPELEELFQDPAHREVVNLLKVSRPAAPPLDPHFRNYLRAKLMTEARHTLQQGAGRPWFAFTLKPRTLAPAMAAVAAGFLVVLGVQIYLHNQPTSNSVVAHLPSKDQTNVATAEPIVIPFTGPVDKNAVADTVVIEPATAVTKHWVGQNLVIIPDHPLAPNTTYTVSLKPTAAPPPVTPNTQPKPTPTVAPTPVILRFTTVPAPVAPVIPPSYKSANVHYGYDSRLADSGTVFGASWTPTGQLLVTRPAGQPGPGSPASPSASASPSGPAAPTATTDVWLMSTLGTPIRLVAPAGSFPAAAPSGGLFAVWLQAPGNQANLEIRDLQGNLQSTVATVDGIPNRPAVWLAGDRLAFVDNGSLRIASLHGATIAIPNLKVDHGSIVASPSGQSLAVESADRSVLIDLTSSSAARTVLDGATGFAWSAKGNLAYLTQHASGTDLFVAPGGLTPARVASSPAGQTWSDLNWAPDGASLLLTSKAAGAGSSASRLMLINADGSALTPFASEREYSSPQWSSHGDFVLFTRQDEAGGRAFWTATTSPSDVDTAEKQALAEVEKFMQARLRGDVAAAQAELDAAGLSAYQSGASSLVSAAGTQFDRYYPVTVQQTGSNPSTFLVGVRVFGSRAGAQRSYFEEQLTLLLKNQRYLVDAVKSTPAMPLSHGPTVVSVEVVASDSGAQVRIRFDADLRADSVSNDTIQVKDADGNRVSSRIAFDPDNHLATLTLKLRPGTTYQLAVTTGVTDINNVALAQEYDAPLVISR
jgi:hypothetical protein